ncbi:cell wall-binding repeat-containing protein [Peptostreptococcus canis]|uniref:Cell wall-binding repeat-containing protein n=1 Tax=Peptostreptococcus canis TaxID=1159213 RepID=A0ABR6TJ35_9FIRM|nr:cell wall-binding repeat-containing protein [Peptostreptococcus canis]MBC2575404.1 cell wall-binding repeat-containing protein [Peptostreptococcus canis]MBP1997408.1 putative cell wall-binding protein [Peptostreptococcus canis]
MKIAKRKIILSTILSVFIMTELSIASFCLDKNENFTEKDQNISIDRIYGEDRFDTSIKVSKFINTEDKLAKYIIIASGDIYPDALSAGVLAGEFNAPLLLVSSMKSNDKIYDYISKISDKEETSIFVVGGEKTISKNVENEISKYGDVTRIFGKNRIETSQLIYEPILKKKGMLAIPDMAAVYSSYNYPDSLTATPFMFQYNRDKKYDFMPFFSIDIKNQTRTPDIVFGGKNSIPDLNEKIRVYGSDRYKTAVEIGKRYKTMLNKDIETIVLVSGEDFPDALSASPLAIKENAAILLTNSRYLNKDTKKYINSNKNIKKIIIVGGENSITQKVEKDLK